MPTYDYLCAKCGQFEVFQSIKDKPLTVCPKCKGRKLKRQIGSGAGIIFKGGGFYETDYRSSSYKTAAQADKPANTTSSGGSGETTKKESKGGTGSKSTPAA